ncbi:MAG TPA: response regulator [Terriglobales bacterium]|nr:response regulator [Terriglobales bacterium]
MRVLVADDEEEFRALIAEFLGRRGLEVIQAANGLEALLQLKRERPAAVVLDLRMPRLGGLEALKRIHAFDPAIAVVVVTAESDPAVREQALALGARAVLGKPVALAELEAALRGQAQRTIGAATDVTTVSAPPPPAVADVLVVDDEAAVRAVLVDYLAAHGYGTREAPDAAAAMRRLTEKAADIVLLDIDMPGLSGADALPTIRVLAPQAVVIMVSGHPDPAVARGALARGAFDYVVKPIDFVYLAQSLEAAQGMARLGP